MKQPKVLSLNRKRWQDYVMSTNHATSWVKAMWPLKWLLIHETHHGFIWPHICSDSNTDKAPCCSLPNWWATGQVLLLLCLYDSKGYFVGPRCSHLPSSSLNSGFYIHTVWEKAEMAKREGTETLGN